MKVVILSKYPLEGLRDGPAMHRDRFIHYISQMKDVALHIVTFGNENKEIKKDNLNIHVIKNPKAFYIPFFIPVTLWFMRRKVIEINPDIVHALGTFAPYSTIATFVRNKYPVVMTLYGIVAEELTKYNSSISYFLVLLLYTLHEKYILSNASNIIVSGLSIKDLISNNTSSKIFVVPYGIESDKIQEIQPHLNEEPDIFYIGELVKGKGVDILIKAIPEIKKSIHTISVRIAGSGRQESEFKTIVKKSNLEKHVEFLGFISEEKKYQYYKACKIVVVPSRWDCQPTTLFETAAVGKPVIASDMSNPEIVDDGKTGLIFESENVEDLANKILILLKDEELREEMGKAVKEKAKQYDWSKIVEGTVEVYKEVITDFHERKVKDKQKREIL